MLTQNEIDALLRERHGYIVAGKKDRAAQVDAVLDAAAPKVEVATDATEVETATLPKAKRGPGRPGKS